jgi:hypothetical protein
MGAHCALCATGLTKWWLNLQLLQQTRHLQTLLIWRVACAISSLVVLVQHQLLPAPKFLKQPHLLAGHVLEGQTYKG